MGGPLLCNPGDQGINNTSGHQGYTLDTIRISEGSVALLRCLYLSDSRVLPLMLRRVLCNVKLFKFQIVTVPLVEQDNASCAVGLSAAMAVTDPSSCDHTTLA